MYDLYESFKELNKLWEIKESISKQDEPDYKYAYTHLDRFLVVDSHEDFDRFYEIKDAAELAEFIKANIDEDEFYNRAGDNASIEEFAKYIIDNHLNESLIEADAIEEEPAEDSVIVDVGAQDEAQAEEVAAEEPIDAEEPVEEPEVDCVAETANAVMASYQNANKWLDSVKEAIYTKMSCPVLSNYIHQLAHKMPQEFDDFGSILHTVNMEIPYPATAEIAKKPATIIEAIEMTLNFLDAIKVALNDFISCTDKSYHGMSCAAEACLNKIEEEYPMLYRLLDNAKKYIDDTVSFEKYVLALVEHKDELLD